VHDENEDSLFKSINLDLKGVQIAKRNNASNEHCEFLIASLCNLLFRDQVFDSGTMWEIIEPIPPNTGIMVL
jgi:hypothetical protein